MGLFLRKKSSKASLKAAKDERRGATPPPQLPPLPDHIRRAEAAAAAATAQSQANSNNKTRRRSRSLWADSDEAKAAAPFSAAGDLASQPWRSHDAWMAFKKPTGSQLVTDELIFPCSPAAQPGWRGRGGGGLFSTEGMLDHEHIRRAATPTIPSSPSSVRRFVASPSLLPSPSARRLDFTSPLAPATRERSGSESQSQSTQGSQAQETLDSEERVSTPPESMIITPSAHGSYPTDACSTGASSDMLITPNSNPSQAASSLLPGFSSPAPAPGPTSNDGSIAQRRRSPSRALPPPPIDDEVPEEVIDFSAPTSPLETPIRTYSGSKSRSNSSNSSHYPMPNQTSVGSMYTQPRSAPSPGPYMPSGRQAQPRSATSTSPYTSPLAITSPLPDAAMRLPPVQGFVPPRRPSMGTSSTPSMLPYAQPSPQPHRSAPRSYEQRPPSRNTSNGSRGNHSRPASRAASSSGHGHSGYHSDAASAPVPHTPEGIAHAVSIWRQKSQRRDIDAALAAGMVSPSPQKEWENPDVFAAAGAWEAPGSYNPYDAAEFEPRSFTAPLRPPRVQPVHVPHPAPPVVRRPSAGRTVNAAQISRAPRVQQQVAQSGWI
ncbi:hypothetical protein CspeluHIS016_0203880 [Cutaneotrichosporon spelunceum]|uniref:Uncharacterized protein n=1 Tax=Cutaneotrichosporon spelunceum TaxID=1672016 RepID=A0AAD3TRU9_9TREE|nr:hypothetical protein CspeluHIS016_0203880 [Cutaneotrichosporon spelunceum]